MTFEEILDQAIAMLQRRGRVSYRALQRQFQLDNAYLQDLAAEIVEVLQLAVDQDNTMLVWTGGSSVPAPVSPPSRTSLPDSQELHLPPCGSAPDVQHAPEAERRQLTVMFCDLVDSTTLSSQLDPEEYREVVRAYHATCAEVIQRFDGHVAQLLGDGLLVYFGYPQAHEDDAQRAVRTGLGILAAMGALNQDLQQAKGIQLALRLGVHTGLVVVGEMGGPGRQEQLALGEVPNIASRIEGLAASNTMAVSEATYRLIQGYFACQDLGAQALRGVPASMCLYRVLGASGVHSRLDVAQPRGLTPLVGRESEVMLLLERWEQVKAGQGHVVLLTGDAGIGKSRLVHMLKAHVTHEPHVRWECRSVESAQNSVLYPLIDLFQRLLQFEAHETPDEKFGKLEQALRQYRPPLEESVALLAPLLALPVPAHAYPPLNLSPQRQRQKTLETIGAILLELAEHQPVLCIVEDLHWTDPTTLELLNLVIEQTPTASMLVLLTCRPHFQPAWHHRSYITDMTLNHLSHTQVAQIVTGMTHGKTFPAEVLQQIIAKTDGVPLFVEEITKAILESGQLKVVDEYYELTGSLSTLTIPATLQDSLMARLDRLVTAKAVAQYAAVIGRQFPYDLLQAVSQVDAALLQHELGRLVEAEIVFQRGVPPQATYIFKHALIQDTAYQSLLRSTRQQYHQRIARVLEAQFPAIVDQQPELLAHHYTEAGLKNQAIGYWQRAGEQAIVRSAHLEAISHLTHGIELLTTLPETPAHLEQELMLQAALGRPLIATKSWAAPETGRAFTRAWELGQRVEATPQRFPVLFGLYSFYVVQAKLQTARDLAEKFLQLARQQHDAVPLLFAHRSVGTTLFCLGELVPAHEHLAQCLTLYDPQQHRASALLYGQDPGSTGLAIWALTLWLLGYPEQACTKSYEAIDLAEEFSHPFSLVYALTFAGMLHQYRREADTVQERTAFATSLATEQGFMQFMGLGTFLRGWALSTRGQSKEGIAQMHQGLDAWRATGSELWYPWSLALLAEAYGGSGQTEEGLKLLTEAIMSMAQTGHCYWEAEPHRLKGELLLQQAFPDTTQAETSFHQALDIAQRQQAKSLELRAATSLAHLWQSQGKRQEAYDLLVPVYNWFTEGFDTADLQEARRLLETLA